jgi:hypothetical protein
LVPHTLSGYCVEQPLRRHGKRALRENHPMASFAEG